MDRAWPDDASLETAYGDADITLHRMPLVLGPAGTTLW